MKRIILMLILIVFIIGCSEQIEKTQEVEGIVEEPEQKPEAEEIEEVEIVCTDYDDNKEECQSHSECKWTSGENICEPIGKEGEEDEVSEDDEEVEENEFTSKLEEGLPNTLPNRICKKLPLTNELSPGDRHYCFAVVNHNAGFCEEIGQETIDEETDTNLCLAIAGEDSSYCKKIQKPSSKHVCYYQLAVISENINFCDDIDYDKNERLQCYFTFVSNLYWWDKSDEIKTEYCNKFPAGESDKNTCLAFKERDVSLCKNNVNCLTFFEQEMSFCEGKGSVLKDCVRDRAMTSKDIPICEELSGEKRDDCIGDFCTHIQLDIAICDKITDDKERQSRYVEIAINLANDNCAKEGEEFSPEVSHNLPKHCCKGLKEWDSGMDTSIPIRGRML